MLLAQHHQVNQAMVCLEEQLSNSPSPGRRYRLLRLQVRLRQIRQRLGQAQIDQRTADQELQAIRYAMLDFLTESAP